MLDPKDCTAPLGGYLVTEALVGLHEVGNKTPYQFQAHTLTYISNGKYVKHGFDAFEMAWKKPGAQVKSLKDTFIPSTKVDSTSIKKFLVDLGLFFAVAVPAMLGLVSPVAGAIAGALSAVYISTTSYYKDSMKE